MSSLELVITIARRVLRQRSGGGGDEEEKEVPAWSDGGGGPETVRMKRARKNKLHEI